MGDLPNPPACIRGAQLLEHQTALIRSLKAALFRCGRSILTEGKAHAATRGPNRASLSRGRTSIYGRQLCSRGSKATYY
jgi:hypothetical protein